MTRLIALTQRVAEVAAYNERRDALDQRWSALLEQAGYLPLLLPNRPEMVLALVHRLQPDGLILTGGNTPVAYGGNAPERDETEHRLLGYALAQEMPVLGVCRGMEVLLTHFGQPLVEVKGHVCQQQTIRFRGEEVTVNSYHNWGCYDVPESFEIEGQAADGVVKAIRHKSKAIQGVMWHPERLNPFWQDDVERLQKLFG
ncbi:MAG TPA: gamma-glutamyl-gamma-aminobutyrate hydrolase family protein [Candidatus Obscuribacterales bacterium]